VLIQNKEEIRKRRTTEGLLSKAEEDLRLLRNQVSGASASKGVADQHSKPHGTGVGRSGSSGLNAGSGGPSASSHPSSHSQSPAPGSYMMQTTNTTDVGSEMLVLLREATSSSRGTFGRNTNLIEDLTDGHTMRTYYRSLKEPWNELPPDQGPVKEFYKVKDTAFRCSVSTVYTERKQGEHITVRSPP
jgi:hypothetical protein